MNVRIRPLLLFVLAAPALAQSEARSSSTFAYSEKDGEKTVRISNVAYQVTQIYNPSESWIVLRNTTRSTQILGDKGWESKVTLEAWPIGSDLSRKPLYAIETAGSEATLLGGELWQVLDEATDPDVPVWSVYRAANGQRLFESFVAPLAMRVPAASERNTFVDRYAGLYVPPDDAADARLRDKHVVAVVAYASPAGTLQEALLTCDSPARAGDLRSYADTERALVFSERPAALEIRFRPGPVVRVPIGESSLDFRRALMPPGIHLAIWKR